MPGILGINTNISYAFINLAIFSLTFFKEAKHYVNKKCNDDSSLLALVSIVSAKVTFYKQTLIHYFKIFTAI